jgi:hypothetical protein
MGGNWASRKPGAARHPGRRLTVENFCFFDRFGARGFATNYPDVAAVSGDFLSVVAMLKTTTIPLHYRLMHAMVQPALETE